MADIGQALEMPDNPSNPEALHVVTHNNKLLEDALFKLDGLKAWIKSVGHVRDK